ncbi:MAG: zinc-dependent metalloprotease, partial [Polyangiaceae bacterium]
MASPLRGMNNRVRTWGQQQLDTAMRLKDTCIMDDLQPEPDSLVGLARQAEQLFPEPSQKDPSYPALIYQRDQAMHQWIREQFHTSVIAHEMGHSMGLRHNFTGSWDALNYHTEYWQLRTRNGQEHYCGYPGSLDATTPHTNGADCVGPRWVDPVTDQETNGLIWKWASTTVMDYPGDNTQDMNDIGNYDKAAMRFGYANIVDVDKNMSYVGNKDGSTGGTGQDYLIALDGFGGIWGSSIGQNHYSTYADKYGVLGTCSPRTGWNGDPSDPLAQQCTGPDLDYVAERDMKTVPKFDSAILSVRPDLVANFAVDPQNRVRHPYAFGSDEFAYGNLPDLRFDAGADSYEMVQFLTSTYENRYIFNNFRRNRVQFNTGAIVGQLTDRYWNAVSWVTKALALGVELLSQPGNDPTTQPGSLMPAALGSADGFNMFVRAMTRPAPGTYVVQGAVPGVTANNWAGAWQLGDQNLETPPSSGVNVGLGSGEGRFIQNDYDYTKGYWWADYQTQVGSYYEKVIAPSYLTEAYNNFISNSEDDYVDGRYKNLSYMSLYPQQVRRLFANMMATNSATQVNQQGAVAQIFTLAPYALPSSTSGNQNPITQVQYLPWDKYDTTSNVAQSVSYPNGAVLLDPLVGWEEQYPALIDLYWYGPTALNMNLIDMLRVFSPGDAASLSIPDAQQVRFRDPVTGIEYVAKNYGSEWVNPDIGFQTSQGIGARMIQHANFLAQMAYQTTGSPDPVTGELTYATNASGEPIAFVA